MKILNQKILNSQKTKLNWKIYKLKKKENEIIFFKNQN